ncbi:MAG: F0F1 ATP synthase subunit delta [Pseudomonadota bacterium]
MAEKATIARPYAKAAFDHAREQGGAATYGRWSDLLGVAAAVAADPAVEPLLGNPKVLPAQLVELIAGVAAGRGLQLDGPGRNFLGVLAQNRRLQLLPEIALQFERLRAEVENAVDVEIVSALPVESAQRAALVDALEQRFGKQVRLREIIDASLVGGALVRAGDLVIDGTLKGRLERLALQMSQQ